MAYETCLHIAISRETELFVEQFNAYILAIGGVQSARSDTGIDGGVWF